MKKLLVKSKIIIFGCGSVGKCCLYYLKNFFQFKNEQVYIIDKDDSVFSFPTVKQAIMDGVTSLHYTITRDNIVELLDKVLKIEKYDIIIDLTTNTPTYDIYKECRLRNILYINTSIEEDKELTSFDSCPTDGGIFLQHMNLQMIADKTRDEANNVTSVIEFGMNPGLISVFVKQGIMDLAKNVIEYYKKSSTDRKMPVDFAKYFKEANHRKLAELLRIRAIHCSEIDTQVPSRRPRERFINTWSCVGLITEGIEPAEIQIGTHEYKLPFTKDQVSEVLPQLVLTKISGQDIKIRSIVPLKMRVDGSVEFTNIEGRCIHHGEGISLNRYLGTFKYSPTMHYAYKLSPFTEEALDKYPKGDLIKISKDSKYWKVLNMYDDNLVGTDNVGALFIMDENPYTGSRKVPYCFWTGSILNTDYTKKVLGDSYFGPTTIQVMAGILSGVSWMYKNRNKGLVFGEDLDDNYIIELAKPYLGHYHSGPVVDKVTLPGVSLYDLVVKDGSEDEKKYVKVKDL